MQPNFSGKQQCLLVQCAPLWQPSCIALCFVCFFYCLRLAAFGSNISAITEIRKNDVVVITVSQFRSTPVGDTSLHSTFTLNVVDGIAGTAAAPKISDPTWAAEIVTVDVPSFFPFAVLLNTPFPVAALLIVATDVSELVQVTDGIYALLVGWSVVNDTCTLSSSYTVTFAAERVVMKGTFVPPPLLIQVESA